MIVFFILLNLQTLHFINIFCFLTFANKCIFFFSQQLQFSFILIHNNNKFSLSNKSINFKINEFVCHVRKIENISINQVFRKTPVKRAQKEISSNRCNSTRRIDGEANATANWKSLWFDDRKKGRMESAWYGKETELVPQVGTGDGRAAFRRIENEEKVLDDSKGSRKGNVAEKVAVTNPRRVIEVVSWPGFTLKHLTLLRLDSSPVSLPKREIFLFYPLILSSTISFLFQEVCFRFFLLDDALDNWIVDFLYMKILLKVMMW